MKKVLFFLESLSGGGAEKVLTDILAFCFQIGLQVTDLDFSPVTGGSGNIEYLILARKGNEIFNFDIKSIVADAFRNFKNGA